MTTAKKLILAAFLLAIGVAFSFAAAACVVSAMTTAFCVLIPILDSAD